MVGEMEAKEITPILNVSDLPASFDWFTKLGWSKHWDWCPPDADAPTFGAVASGKFEIFLCLDGQGGRGDHGAWISIWVDDGAIHSTCISESLEVLSAPEDKLWGVREMLIRHPDGHTFRISTKSHDA